jgi:uncharacterized membrane protein
MDKLTKIDIIKNILDDVDQELLDDEIIDLVVSRTVSKRVEEKMTFGQRAADKMAKIAGSWIFVLGFLIVLFTWIGINVLLAGHAFDPFPFILMNLILSCVAAIQAPVIMMSQHRQEEKDRARAENDYMVNLKAEIIIQDLHDKLDSCSTTRQNCCPPEPTHRTLPTGRRTNRLSRRNR